MRSSRRCSPRAIPIATRRSARWPTSTPPAWTTSRNWFRDNYGPNNAVLVLAGDIDAATARPLVEHYFGDIPRGPVNNAGRRPTVPTLAAPKSIGDARPRRRHPALRATGSMPGPARSDSWSPLDVGGAVLGGLASSRLDKMLVRGEKSAVGVGRALRLPAGRHVRRVRRREARGQDPAVVEKRLDEIVAEFIANGPTEDEVRRAAMTRGRRPHPGARAGRRLRRQGGRRWPKGSPMPATANGMRRTSPPMPRSRRPTFARR